jgi:hypothetical protein
VVRLFDLENSKIIPTEHCYTLKALSDIMTTYPDDYMKVYAYLFYMTCPNPDLNPFFDMDEADKEELILREIQATFSLDSDCIANAISLCKQLYETPTSRAYTGIKSMLDRLATYMEETPIVHGRDGNITALVNAAAKFQLIRESYKGVYKDLQNEQQSHVRGGQGLAYDQI